MSGRGTAGVHIPDRDRDGDERMRSRPIPRDWDDFPPHRRDRDYPNLNHTPSPHGPTRGGSGGGGPPLTANRDMNNSRSRMMYNPHHYPNPPPPPSHYGLPPPPPPLPSPYSHSYRSRSHGYPPPRGPYPEWDRRERRMSNHGHHEEFNEDPSGIPASSPSHRPTPTSSAIVSSVNTNDTLPKTLSSPLVSPSSNIVSGSPSSTPKPSLVRKTSSHNFPTPNSASTPVHGEHWPQWPSSTPPSASPISSTPPSNAYMRDFDLRSSTHSHGPHPHWERRPAYEGQPIPPPNYPYHKESDAIKEGYDYQRTGQPHRDYPDYRSTQATLPQNRQRPWSPTRPRSRSPERIPRTSPTLPKSSLPRSRSPSPPFRKLHPVPHVATSQIPNDPYYRQSPVHTPTSLAQSSSLPSSTFNPLPTYPSSSVNSTPLSSKNLSSAEAFLTSLNTQPTQVPTSIPNGKDSSVNGDVSSKDTVPLETKHIVPDTASTEISTSHLPSTGAIVDAFNESKEAPISSSVPQDAATETIVNSSILSTLLSSSALAPSTTPLTTDTSSSAPAGGRRRRAIGFGMGLAAMEKRKQTVNEPTSESVKEEPVTAGSETAISGSPAVTEEKEKDDSIKQENTNKEESTPSSKVNELLQSSEEKIIPRVGSDESQAAMIPTPKDHSAPSEIVKMEDVPSVDSSVSALSEKISSPPSATNDELKASTRIENQSIKTEETKDPTKELEVVEKEKEAEKDDNTIPPAFLAMTKMEILKAIQELDEKINTQERERDDLKESIRDLKKRQQEDLEKESGGQKDMDTDGINSQDLPKMEVEEDHPANPDGSYSQPYREPSEYRLYRNNALRFPVDHAYVAAIIARRKRSIHIHSLALSKKFVELERQYLLEENQRGPRKFSLPTRGRGNSANSTIDLATWGEYDMNDEEEVLEYESKKARWSRGLATIPPMIIFNKKHPPIQYHNRNGFIEDPKEEERQFQNRNPWTAKEKEIFEVKYSKFPKQFRKIASFLPNKNVNECVAYYYLSKLTVNYQELVRKNTRAKGSKKKRNPREEEEDAEIEIREEEEEEIEEKDRRGRPRKEKKDKIDMKRGKGAAAKGISRELIGLAIDLSNYDARVGDAENEENENDIENENENDLETNTAVEPTQDKSNQEENTDNHEMHSGDEGNDSMSEENHSPHHSRSSRSLSPSQDHRRKRRRESKDLKDVNFLRHDKYAEDNANKEKKAVIHWSQNEKDALLGALAIHGKDWSALSSAVPSRTLRQIKTFFQNYKGRIGSMMKATTGGSSDSNLLGLDDDNGNDDSPEDMNGSADVDSENEHEHNDIPESMEIVEPSSAPDPTPLMNVNTEVVRQRTNDSHSQRESQQHQQQQTSHNHHLHLHNHHHEIDMDMSDPDASALASIIPQPPSPRNSEPLPSPPLPAPVLPSQPTPHSVVQKGNVSPSAMTITSVPQSPPSPVSRSSTFSMISHQAVPSTSSPPSKAAVSPVYMPTSPASHLSSSPPSPSLSAISFASPASLENGTRPPSVSSIPLSAIETIMSVPASVNGSELCSASQHDEQ